MLGSLKDAGGITVPRKRRLMFLLGYISHLYGSVNFFFVVFVLLSLSLQ